MEKNKSFILISLTKEVMNYYKIFNNDSILSREYEGIAKILLEILTISKKIDLIVRSFLPRYIYM